MFFMVLAALGLPGYGPHMLFTSGCGQHGICGRVAVHSVCAVAVAMRTARTHVHTRTARTHGSQGGCMRGCGGGGGGGQCGCTRRQPVREHWQVVAVARGHLGRHEDFAAREAARGHGSPDLFLHRLAVPNTPCMVHDRHEQQ